ncbi:erythrocyte membrane protein 1, PfEMP1, putative [Plasmodium sp. gorilla clade G1]|nr:erythrocyte membrane protein 1, PfEMP1, putative [Plasmodium sp. gorilla clade G1]
MAPGSAGTQDGADKYKTATDAKHLLDMIGKDVHEEVKKEAETYKGEFKGNLTSSTFFDVETASSLDPCKLVDDYRSNGNGGTIKNNPCGSAGEKRFSKEHVSEYDEKNIKDNKGKGGGNERECAPYRRLSLCNKNMEYLNSYDGNNSKDYLLAKVCYAAKHEGESITRDYPKYEAQYPGSVSTTCTELARSFADIGDIVRGRDLYRGGGRGREKLEKNLKDIFRDIYNDVTSGRRNDALQARYKNNDENYYQLREDWWTANRETVWKALTCDAPQGASYFHATCSDERGGAQANHYCRCTKGDQVPTYFDYVPQYLRWFQEWGEDFCRKKNKKIKDVRTNCLDETNEKYCSRNGYDCTKSKRAIGRLRMGNQCTKCFFACNPYVDWIEKQKEQFDKQVKKYETEISGGDGRGSRRQRRGARGITSSNYYGYEKKFYEKLRHGDVDLDKFLEKLSNEEVCTKVKDDKGGKINFKEVNSGGGSVGTAIGGTSDTTGTNDKTKGTFYRSEYCQPCPHCGMKKKGDGKWIPKQEDEKCKHGNLYKPKAGVEGTEIIILKSGDGQTEIAEKLNKFCAEKNGGIRVVVASASNSDSHSKELYQDWKCYEFKELDKVGQVEDEDEDYENDVKEGGGLCILKNNKNKKEKEKKYEPEPNDIQKTFYDFFTYWVAHMLKDSIHWRTKKLKGCLENAKAMKCKNGCNTKCDCFLKWITQKKNEWGKIKEHFYKQENIDNQGVIGAGMTPDFVLQENLKEEFFKEDSEEKSENNLDAEEAKELKHLREIIESEKNEEELAGARSGPKTIMDKLIDQEENDATKCKDCKKPEENRGAGRSDTFTPDGPQPPGEESDEEEEEDHGPDDDNGDQQEEEELQPEAPQEPGPKEEGKPPCKIVEELFKDVTTLQEACTLKYGPGGKEKFPNWKCISGDNTTTSEGGDRSGRNRRSTLRLPTTAESAEPTSDGVTTTTSSGAICIPPRRRKLYVGKLEEWATNTVSQLDIDAPSSNLRDVDDLLKAFVESAAVETFFLWHRYKKEWEQKNKPQNGGLPFDFLGGASSFGMTALHHNGVQPRLPIGAGLVPGVGVGVPGVGVAPGVGALGGGPIGPRAGPQSLLEDSFNLLGSSAVTSESGENQSPDKELASGEIPIDFLRQMFYTLGDYRDILFSGSNDSKNSVNDIFSGDKEMAQREKTIKDAIQKFFQNGDKQATGGPPVKPSSQTPQTWWEQHGKHIWEGMICALTYKDNSDTEAKSADGTSTLKQDDDVYKKFFGDKPSLPGPPGIPKANTEGTYNDRYKYETVKLEEENSGTEAKSTYEPLPSGDNTPTTLTNFISRPPYFRYLEEWGQNFCKERTKRLEKIEEECKVDEGARGKQKNPKCSCDGEDCQYISEQNYSIISNFKCPKCGIHCSSYKKWIRGKRKEYEKQKNAYEEHKKNCKKESEGAERNKDDKEFCATLTKFTEAKDFLQKLGPCSKNNNGNENGKENEENKTDFKNEIKTFGPADNCKPCSKFNVNCKNGNCGSDANGEQCKGIKSIGANDIKKMRNSTKDVSMIVSDNSGNGFTGVLDECQNVGMFDGIRKEQWKCGYVCGVDICEQTNVNGGTDGKEYIQIRAFVRRWVDNFLDDYNKIKHKISHCTKNGEKIICIKDCVEKWINIKKKEWETIRERYFEQYKGAEPQMKSLVKNFLEDMQSQIHVTIDKAIKPCNGLDNFESSCGLNRTQSAKQSKRDENKDLVLCLIEKLEKKISECTSQASAENLAQCKEYTPPDDEHLLLEEENPENTVGKQQPSFCPEQQQPEPVDEDTCKPEGIVKEEEEEKEEEKDKGDEEEDELPPPQAPEASKPEPPVKPAPRPPPPAKPPRVKPKSENPWEHPIVIPSLATSTLMWTVGIGFAAFTYFFLKKKTKSSVANLFQILEIPKGDYDIPTLKSSNRYIPYASDRYKGKTYIYMEGDSSGDEKYAFMSDTTDITSSESEYEEMDINDIYAPGSPKYKTLIEVVLEPSKRDIQSDDTPSNKFTDNEWNQLKKDFISNMLQNTQNTEPNILHDNVNNNIHPTMSRHNVDQKPFIMSIHDRNLYIGEEYSYDMSTNSGENNVYSGIDPTSDNRGPYSDKNDPISGTKDPISDNHHPYSGIDLINDALNGDYDIYDEILKRKENELFGTNHTKKNTSTNSVAKNTNSDPILNQINLFHKWLDRHRNICEEWDKNKVELLDKLKKEWNKENNNNGDKTYNSDNKPSHNHVLNTDVSIQIDMDNPKPKNEFTNMDTNPDKSTMDTILDDLEKYNEPYYYDFYKDDIYYDVNDDDKTSMDNNNNLVHKNNPVDSNNSTYNHLNPANINKNFVDKNNQNQHPIEKPTKIQIEMNSNNREVIEQQYPIADIWNI